MDTLLDRLAASVTRARTLEELARPLLEVLQSVSGLDSAYLTVIDAERDEQRILFSRNTRTMQIPEGLAVPWGDTLCKRALDEGKPFTSNVSDCWGDSDAARALGIETYLSTPVRVGEDEHLYGTLCAASADRVTPSAEVEHLLSIFATLLGQHIEREQLLRDLLEANDQLQRFALTDMLTGLPNRRALLGELTRLLAHNSRTGGHVLIAFLDLDHFKAINDRYGHDGGDVFLLEMAQRLQMGLRSEDLAARLGGDEFVVIAPGPIDAGEAKLAGDAFATRVAGLTKGQFIVRGQALDYAGASVGLAVIAPGATNAAQALDHADTAMFEVKRARHTQMLGAAGQ